MKADVILCHYFKHNTTQYTPNKRTQLILGCLEQTVLFLRKTNPKLFRWNTYTE